MDNADPVDTITVYSDYVCPFCYLGRESLAQYRETRETPLRVDWHPFDLRADRRGPDGAVDTGGDADSGKDEAYYARVRENVRRLQEEYGVEMAQELATDVDSLNAQVAAVAVRDEHGSERWLSFDGSVFDALWVEGRDIGDPDVLADVARRAGVDPGRVREAVDDDRLRRRVRDQFEEATQRGVTGVPTFVHGDHAARGAVPPAHLERLVDGH